MNWKKVTKSLYSTLIFILCATFTIIFYSIFVEPNILVVKHKKLYLPNWSQQHNGLKIAVLSDFHINKSDVDLKRLKKIVNKTNKENPDLTLMLGDLDAYLINKDKINTKEVSEILSNLIAKYGVISILGNHDYHPNIIKPILKNANIEILENKKTTKIINNTELLIYGVKDLWQYQPDPRVIINENNAGKSIILLSHNPDLFPIVPEFVSLTLSGHTHGGQVCLPFFGGIFTPSIWEQRYNKGHIVENEKHIFVSSGLGFAVPFRIGNPPEIVILELFSLETYPNKKIINTKELKGLEHSFNALGYKTYKFLNNYIKF